MSPKGKKVKNRNPLPFWNSKMPESLVGKLSPSTMPRAVSSSPAAAPAVAAAAGPTVLPAASYAAVSAIVHDIVDDAASWAEAQKEEETHTITAAAADDNDNAEAIKTASDAAAAAAAEYYGSDSATNNTATTNAVPVGLPPASEAPANTFPSRSQQLPLAAPYPPSDRSIDPKKWDEVANWVRAMGGNPPPQRSQSYARAPAHHDQEYTPHLDPHRVAAPPFFPLPPSGPPLSPTRDPRLGTPYDPRFKTPQTSAGRQVPMNNHGTSVDGHIGTTASNDGGNAHRLPGRDSSHPGVQLGGPSRPDPAPSPVPNARPYDGAGLFCTSHHPSISGAQCTFSNAEYMAQPSNVANPNIPHGYNVSGGPPSVGGYFNAPAPNTPYANNAFGASPMNPSFATQPSNVSASSIQYNNNGAWGNLPTNALPVAAGSAAPVAPGGTTAYHANMLPTSPANTEFTGQSSNVPAPSVQYGNNGFGGPPPANATPTGRGSGGPIRHNNNRLRVPPANQGPTITHSGPPVPSTHNDGPVSGAPHVGNAQFPFLTSISGNEPTFFATHKGPGSPLTRTHRCDRCGQVIYNRELGERHVRICHPGGHCFWPGCHRDFSTEKGLIAHMKAHYGGELLARRIPGGTDHPLMYNCPWPTCNIWLDYKAVIEDHVWFHNPSYPPHEFVL